MNNAIDKLPLTNNDRNWLEKTLDMLSDEPVTDYDAAEVLSQGRGYTVYSMWEDARTVPLIRYADHRPAKTLDSFGPFDPIPSRQHVLDALAEAAEEWEVTA